MEHARGQVAALVGAPIGDVVFTSGATESNNLALKGAARMRASPGNGSRGHLVTSAVEHPSVRRPMQRLQREGFDVTVVGCGADGVVTAADVEAALRDDTLLVSIMWANNETGVINEIEALADCCRERTVLLHVDAAQLAGKRPIDLSSVPVDLLSLTAHKMGGPPGAGALVVRSHPTPVALEPLLEGASQERGLRAGTPNVPAIVGLGKVCAVAAETMEVERARLGALRDRIESILSRRLDDVVVNGHPEQRVEHIANLSLGGVEAATLIEQVTDVAFATGSACAAGSDEPSGVLTAMGLDERRALSAVRLSLGRTTTEDEVDEALDRIVEAAAKLRVRVT